MSKVEVVDNEEREGQEGERFLFLGEVLALDLVDTEVVVRGKWSDKLETGQDVQEWWEEVRRRYPGVEGVRGENEEGTVYDRALLDAIKALRAALRHIFGALVEGRTPMDADVQVLNDVLHAGYHVLARGEGGDLLGGYSTHDGTKGKVLLPIALSVLHLIQDGERKRLHKCDNERCIMYFYDTTKSATRRWCSPGCMDRARSAQRYRLAKEKKVTSV